jgi:hypothetical protein
MSRRAAALSVLGAGLVLIVGARLALPAAPPLYDGIVPIEPYLWLDPPPGHPGGAKGATADIAIRNGKSPLVALATPELEPQAQVFAPPEGLTVQAGARRISVSIEPVPSEGVLTDGHVDGNVYRISLVDDRGTALTAPAAARVSVVLRATDPAQGEATIARFADGSWQPLKTSSAGFGGSFIAVVTEFGDFAVIVPGPGPSVAATEVSTSSPGVSGAAAVPPTPPSSGSPAANVPGSPSDTAGLSGFVLAAILVLVIGLGLLGYRAVRRRRGDPYRGAHRVRRR